MRKAERHSRPCWLIAVAGLLASCGEPCTVPPCALPVAANVAVSRSDGSGAIPGLTVAVDSGPGGFAQCLSGNECVVYGSIGDYTITLSGTGFVSRQIKFTVTGESAAKCGCAQVDTKRVSVVLSPAT